MIRTRFYCNICKNSTWHEVVADVQQLHRDYFWDADKLLHGQILKCCGCDYLSFRLYEHPYDFEENGKVKEHIYPTREFTKREQVFFFSLPKGILEVYKQTNEAYDNKLYLLAAIGLRALVEAIVTNRLPEGEYGASIQSKIDALRKYFSKEVVDTLQDFRFMGNKAVHALEEPNGLDIHRALNVVEGVMTFFFSVDESARSFKMLKETNAGG